MASPRNTTTREDHAAAVLAKISDYAQKGFPEAELLHKLITQAYPELEPRLWYGMPGYALSKDSAVLVFFRQDELISFGITEAAANKTKISGATPSAWYITEINDEVAQLITSVVHSLK